MGGEPTFVSVDDMISPQWRVAADGPEKRVLANRLAGALAERYAKGGLTQRGQGKWYPGRGPAPLADRAGLAGRRAAAVERSRRGWPTRTTRRPRSSDAPGAGGGAGPGRSPPTSGCPRASCGPATRTRWPACWPRSASRKGRRPTATPRTPTPAWSPSWTGPRPSPAAWALPLVPSWFGDGWASPDWRTRRGRLVLVPGESPAGMRLPLGSLSWRDPDFRGEESFLRAKPDLATADAPPAVVVDPSETEARTALVVEARDGFVHVFLPPLEQLEPFCALVALVDRAAERTGTAVVLEGYGPPPDPRIRQLMVTPDPGVIEVNVHPTASWTELAELTRSLYALARECRLGAETFAVDGRHSGTGGGSHLTLGGPEPSRSPLLRRPDLLVSLLTFWQHHPSLVLPVLRAVRRAPPARPRGWTRAGRRRCTSWRSPSPRSPGWPTIRDSEHRPWVVDRALRHLLTDITGNTHRSEFCVDKLYNPDALRGRLGLLELRGFEMAPHPDMALVQALLVRALVARFAEQPYSAPLVRWGTALHERFLLPHFAMADLAEVVADLRAHDLDLDLAWFDVFAEFRFPLVGVTTVGGVGLELRTAIEPWYVLGEEASSGATARYVDSSTERLQVRVTGFAPARHLLTCNGRPVPLTATGTPGEYVAGRALPGLAAVVGAAPHPGDRLAARLRRDRPGQRRLPGRGDLPRRPSGRAGVRLTAGQRCGGRGATGAYGSRRSGRLREWWTSRRSTPPRAWRAAEPDEFPVTLDLRRRRPPHWGRG